MKNIKNRLERERRTIETMIQMYCKKFHDDKKEICQSCKELNEYANFRLKNCPFGENKPTCKNCPIHCYKSDMREEVRKVMRYAGPRMIYSHPIMGFRHIFTQFKKVEDLGSAKNKI